jgi:hypothetical protein
MVGVEQSLAKESEDEAHGPLAMQQLRAYGAAIGMGYASSFCGGGAFMLLCLTAIVVPVTFQYAQMRVPILSQFACISIAVLILACGIAIVLVGPLRCFGRFNYGTSSTDDDGVNDGFCC